MRLRLATLYIRLFHSFLGRTSQKLNTTDTKTSTKRFLAGLIICGRFLIEPAPKMSLTTSASRLPRHEKCRREVYANTKGVNRFPVPKEKIEWSVDWPEYKPRDFTDPKVVAGPVWADPEIRGPNGFKMKFNRVDGKINRRSHMKPDYETPGGVPRNPCGRTGVTGRGELGKWGPNHAADPLVTRWKRDAQGQVVTNAANQKVLQFIAICRKDSGEWAIPGGMVDAGETVSVTLRREFGEEAMNSLDASPKELKKIQKAVGELFKHGIEVYRGYVDDPRNTDNSWMETIVVNFHDGTGSSVGKFALNAGDDAGAVQWTDIDSGLSLFASHASFIEKVARRLDAHW